MDLAELGFLVDTSGLLKASKEVDNVERKVDDLVKSIDLLGNKFKQVANDIARSIRSIDFRQVNQSIDSVKNKLSTLKNKDIIIKIIENGANTVKNTINSINGKTVKVTIESNSRDVDLIRNSINSIQDKSVNITVDYDNSVISNIETSINRISDKTVTISSSVDDAPIINLISLIDSIQDKAVIITTITDQSQLNALSNDINSLNNRVVNIDAAVNDQRLNSLNNSLSDTDRQLQNVTESTNRFSASVLAVPATIGAGVALGLAHLTGEFLENSKELERNAERYEMTRQEMQLWTTAADSMKAGGIDIAEVFQDIDDKLGDFLITGGGGAVDIFERLGLKFDEVRDKNPAEVLQTVINKMDELGNVSDKERTFLLEGLASDASKLQPLLENNGRALKELMETAKSNFTILNNNQLGIIKESATQLTNVKAAMSGVGKQAGVVGAMILSALAEPLIDAFHSIAEYLSDTENATQLVNTAFAALGAIAVPALTLIGSGLWGAVAAGLAFAATPFGAIITAISAITGAVIYFRDEVITMGDSTASVMDWVYATFEYVRRGVVKFAEGMSLLFRLVAHDSGESFGAMGQYMDALLGVGKAVINGLIGFFVGGAKAFVTAFEVLPPAIYNIFASIYNSVVQTMNNMIVAAVEPINTVLSAIGEAPISVGNTFDQMSMKAVDSSKSISGAFSSAFKTDYVGEFGSAVKGAFDGITADIGNIAEDRRLERMLNDADKSFSKMGRSAVEATKKIEAYNPPAKDAGKTTKSLSDAQKSASKSANTLTDAQKVAKKAVEELAKSRADLIKSFDSEIDKLKKEAFAVGKSEIAIYKYDVAHKTFGETQLKYNDSQVAALVAEKKRVLSLKEQEEANKKAEEAAKKHREEIDNIVKSYDDELQAAKLDLIEIEKGERARDKAELAIKGVIGVLSEKILKTKDETEEIKRNIEQAKESIKARNDAIDAIKKEKEQLGLQLTELKNGTLARYEEELAIKGIKGALAEKLKEDYKENEELKEKIDNLKKSKDERDKALKSIKDNEKQLEYLRIEYEEGEKAISNYKSKESGLTDVEIIHNNEIKNQIERYEDLIKKRKDAEKGVEDITKKYELHRIEITQGKDAMEQAKLVQQGYTEEQAAYVVATQNAINTQKKFSDGLRSAITEATSIKDAFKNVGDFLKDWLLDQIKMFAVNKITAYVTTAFTGGSSGGISGLLGGGGGDLTGSLISAGMSAIGGGSGGLLGSLGGLLGGGTAGATSGIMGGLTSIGSSIAALANPITAAILAGGFIISDWFEKGEVKATFANKAEQTEFNDWRSGWYNSSKRAEGVDFTRTSDFGQFGLLGDGQSIHIGRDDGEQVANITRSLDAIKQLDDVIASFLPDSVIEDVKIKLDGFEYEALDMSSLTVERLGVIFSSIPNELSKLVDVNQPVEDVVARINNIKLASEVLVPELENMGLNLGDTTLSVLANTVAMADAGGGVDEFAGKVALFSAEFVNTSSNVSSGTNKLISDIEAMNDKLGLSGDEFISTKGDIVSFVQSLDLTSESGREAFLVAMDYQESLLEVNNRVEKILPSLENLNKNIGDNDKSITKTVLSLADYAGGVDKLKKGMDFYYDTFFSSEEQKDIALQDSVFAVNQYRDTLTAQQRELLDTQGFRAFVESLDLTKEAEQRVFISSMDVAGAMNDVANAGQAAATAFAGYKRDLENQILQLKKGTQALKEKEYAEKGLTKEQIADLKKLDAELNKLRKTTSSSSSTIRIATRTSNNYSNSINGTTRSTNTAIKANEEAAKAAEEAAKALKEEEERERALLNARDRLKDSNLIENFKSMKLAMDEAALSNYVLNGLTSDTSDKTELFINNISELNRVVGSGTESVYYNMSSMISLSDSFGMMGDSLITTNEGVLNYARTLDLSTDSGQKALDKLVLYSGGIDSLNTIVSDVIPEFDSLGLKLGITKESSVLAVAAIADLAGGIDALSSKMNSYYNDFYSQEERDQIDLTDAAIAVDNFNDFIKRGGDAAITSSSGFRDYVESLDLTTKAGQNAFVAAMDVSKSMKLVFDSGQSLDDILSKTPEKIKDLSFAVDNLKDSSDILSEDINTIPNDFVNFSDEMSDSSSLAANSIKRVGDISQDVSFSIDNFGNSVSSLDMDTSSLVSSQSDINNILSSVARSFDSVVGISDDVVINIDGVSSSLNSLSSAASSTASSIYSSVDKINSLVSSATASAAAASAAASSVDSSSTADGSHALGLDYVPRDNYIATLHAGEAVIDAASVFAIKRYFKADVSTNKSIIKPLSKKNIDYDLHSELKLIKNELESINNNQVEIGQKVIDESITGNNINLKINKTLSDNNKQQRARDDLGVYI